MSYAIEIDNLVVEYLTRRRRVHAVNGLSLQVPAGQVFGFIGPNGAGKTTTIHALLGFIGITAGNVKVLGHDIRHSKICNRIGYMPESPEVYRFLSGREFLHMMGRLFNLPTPLLRQRADDLLERVGLTQAADRRVGVYSRGMLQRLGLAQALINDPELVILDEPTSGFDPLGRVEVRGIIEELRHRGRTVFFSSHELSEVEKVCDCVGIIIAGRTVAVGAVSDLVQPGASLEQYFLSLMT